MDLELEKEPASGITFPESVLSSNRDERKMKREEIVRACDRGNLKQLVLLASSPGGLLDDELRQSACRTAISLCSFDQPTDLSGPILLRCAQHRTGPRQPDPALELAPHPDEEQVQRDVDRAFVYYPNSVYSLVRLSCFHD